MQGTYEFMSDDMLDAADLGVGYLQSPVDDLFSHYYTMQWAAAFHATAGDIPLHLTKLREDLSGIQRSNATKRIVLFSPRKNDYGQFLVDCQPFLRDMGQVYSIGL